MGPSSTDSRVGGTIRSYVLKPIYFGIALTLVAHVALYAAASGEHSPVRQANALCDTIDHSDVIVVGTVVDVFPSPFSIPSYFVSVSVDQGVFDSVARGDSLRVLWGVEYAYREGKHDAGLLTVFGGEVRLGEMIGTQAMWFLHGLSTTGPLPHWRISGQPLLVDDLAAEGLRRLMPGLDSYDTSDAEHVQRAAVADYFERRWATLDASGEF